MEKKKPGKKYSWKKKLLITATVLIIIGSLGVWYIFTDKFTDTAERKAAHVVSAIDLIHEFEKNDSVANAKYAEKIMLVSGIVSELESADSSLNVKMSDTLSGSYIIFAFQRDNLGEARKLKIGDSVSIKGSCSGGAYSEILGTQFINFKRSIISRN